MNTSAPESAGAGRPTVYVLSMHTSPLAQPGQGDAGGMNVYVSRLSAALARSGVRVEAFTLVRTPPNGTGAGADGHSATKSSLRPWGAVRSVSPAPGVRVHEVWLPTARGATKTDLPDFVEPFAAACADLIRSTGPTGPAIPGPDLVHAHYWLSGLAGLALRRELARRGSPREQAGTFRAPLVLTLHTSARGKNQLAGPGEAPEPESRARAEERLVREAEALVVNTEQEAQEMVRLYGADPHRMHVIPPGVDTAVFRPTPERTAREGFRVLFAGRPQPLKGPEILLRAAALARAEVPGLRVQIRGTASEDYLDSLHRLARELDLDHAVEFHRAGTPDVLAQAMRESDAVACPSSSETFGLVALESQACGTPVAASDVGGLRAALDQGRSGILVPERTPEAWSRALVRLAGDPDLRHRLRERGLAHARSLTWDAAARRTLDAYHSLVPSIPVD